MPIVSVIVPNYNHAPFLRQRLASIFNQTFQDFEVIILDDCSTDNSKEIINEYRDRPQVSHVVYNKKNSGSPFKQWAKGFELAQGEYIWIAESDDWAEPSFLEEMVPILDNDNSLSFAYCNSYIEDGTKPKPFTRNSFDYTRKISGNVMLKYLCQGCCVYNASSVIFRKDCAINIDHKYQSFYSSGDYLFWILLSMVGNAFYNYNALNHYRIHEANTSLINALDHALIENFQIYKFLEDKGYYSFFEKHIFILARLKEFGTKKNAFSNPQHRLIYELYRKEIVSTTLSTLFVKIGTIFWKLFH